MRSLNFLKNFFLGSLGQVLTALFNFVVRTVFIYTLSEAYLGVNGLLSSVLSVLNLANLGIDAAIIYAMYKPVAEKDIDQTKSLLRFYRKAYRLIGTFILALGFAVLTPLLPYLAKGSTELVDLRIVFWLYLLDTACSYFFFAYLNSLLVADQRNYVASVVNYAVQFFRALTQIIMLLLLRKTPALAFYVHTAVGLAYGIMRNLLVRRRVLQLYPWAKDRDARPLPAEEKRSIFRNVVGMSTNNICRVLNDGIDSTIISAFLGLGATGIFSNYLALKTYLLNFLKIIFHAMTAGVGNLCATETDEKKESFFHALQFSCFWIYGFCAICFWTLLDSFIVGVWLHDTKWLLPRISVFLLSFNFLIEGLAKAVIVYRDANGLYWQTKFRYIFSSVFNAVISIVFVGPLHMGVTGALLGTSASLVIMLSYDPALVYRHVFHKKSAPYYRTYFLELLLVLATGGVVHLICLPFSAYTAGCFLFRAAVCLTVPNGLWYLLFRTDPRFGYLRDTAAGYLKKAKSRLRKE